MSEYVALVGPFSPPPPAVSVNLVELRLVPVSRQAKSYYIGRRMEPLYSGRPLSVSTEVLYVYDSVSLTVCGVEFDEVYVMAEGVFTGSLKLDRAIPGSMCAVLRVPVEPEAEACSVSKLTFEDCRVERGCVDLTPGLYKLECGAPCYVARGDKAAYGVIDAGSRVVVYAERVCSSGDFTVCAASGDLSKCRHETRLYILIYSSGRLVAYGSVDARVILLKR